MSRRLRHVPKGEPYEAGTLVEVTCRTIQGRYLLRPSAELNEIVIGDRHRSSGLRPAKLPDLHLRN